MEFKELKNIPYSFTNIYPIKEHYDFYKRWVKEGYHGEMKYMEKIKERESLDNIFREAKSCMVIGIPYYIEIPQKEYRISRYAIFYDYHLWIKERLKEILKKYNVYGKIYIDTGPILERSFAQKAGLGFIGKNTNLISFKKGSYFFLAEIILPFEIRKLVNGENENFCGKCKKCIEACPTGALKENFLLDARKCISYLTIEYKGIIEEELIKKIGNNIFGCDICQEVCPWNKNPLKYDENFLKPNYEILNFSLEDFLRLKEEDFKKIFKNTPFKRIGYINFLRNCIICAGNTDFDKYKKILKEFLKSNNEILQIHTSFIFKNKTSPSL
ncbi:MAG: tRNA epoxyqueuosine(34) reductase QueG [candidate division WOR-3 bacterium]